MLFVWGAVFEVWLSVLFCVSDDPLATSAGEDLVSVTESESGDCRSESFLVNISMVDESEEICSACFIWVQWKQ